MTCPNRLTYDHGWPGFTLACYNQALKSGYLRS